MSQSFNPIDIENERIEIINDDGSTTVFRPLAALSDGEEIYFVFGAVKPAEDAHGRQLRLMLMRREQSESGEPHFVVCEDTEEVEEILAPFIRQMVDSFIDDSSDEDDETESACTQIHTPLEFCYCGQPEYLQ